MGRLFLAQDIEMARTALKVPVKSSARGCSFNGIVTGF